MKEGNNYLFDGKFFFFFFDINRARLLNTRKLFPLNVIDLKQKKITTDLLVKNNFVICFFHLYITHFNATMCYNKMEGYTPGGGSG